MNRYRRSYSSFVCAVLLPTALAVLAGCSLTGQVKDEQTTGQEADNHSGARSFFEGIGNYVLGSIGMENSDTFAGGPDAMLGKTESLSPEEEYFLGRAVAARILSNFQLSQDKELLRYVNRVGSAVAAFSDQPETFGGFHFAIIETSQINAISAPGGFIFLSRGLLDALPDEDALAAVLAHEVGHVIRKHGVRSLSKEDNAVVFDIAGRLAGGLTCNEVLADAAVVLSSLAGNVYDTLVERGYSRDFEFEADQESARILARAGYEVRALDDVLAQLELSQEGSSGGWFSTHPSATDRRNEIAGLISHYPVADETQAHRLLRQKRFTVLVHSAQGQGVNVR